MTPEATIAQLQEELAALRQEQRTFTATVTHDLRAPLRHISAYAQLLQEEAAPVLNAEARGFIDTISNAALTLSAQLDALSAYAALATAELRPQCVALAALVQEIVRDLALQPPVAADAQAHVVQWVIAPDLPVVWADGPMVRQALTHVLGNAVFFSQRNAAPLVRITGSVDASNGAVSLFIEDNGMGCDLKHTDRLFSVFARMHSPRQLQGMRALSNSPAGFVAGLGMGLASTRRIVLRVGGDVTLQSTPDAGCCVRLQLPAAPPTASSRPA